jgi:hypothetical protein
MNPSPDRFVLRNLPLASRLVLAAAFISIGIGYFAALIQVHFQHASAGKLLPGADDAVSIFSGQPNTSQLERLLISDEKRPFNGTGSMRQTFTTKSAGWKNTIRKRAREKDVTPEQAEAELRLERDGERLVLLDWIRNGAKKEAFENGSYPMPAALVSHPMTAEFMETGSGKVPCVNLPAIFETRCARCHAEGVSSAANRFPLENWEQIHDYCVAEESGGGVSVKRLAQSSHIHLLAFSMLYCLTGLAFSLTSYPGWLRIILAPLPLVAGCADIGLWWMARVDPMYARAIVFTGGLVATSLFLQLGLTLFNLFGKPGKVFLASLLIAACVAGYEAKQRVIDPYLAQEATSTETGK